jgi:hypothetical protein
MEDLPSKKKSRLRQETGEEDKDNKSDVQDELVSETWLQKTFPGFPPAVYHTSYQKRRKFGVKELLGDAKLKKWLETLEIDPGLIGKILDFAKIRVYETIDSVVKRVLDKVSWPMLASVKLEKWKGDGRHSKKANNEAIKCSPNTNVPNLLLYKLGDKTFIGGAQLKDFERVKNRERTILLAPSGAGKTRKLFELLYHEFGYYIPYLPNGDTKNVGSHALYSVFEQLIADATTWENVSFVNRREHAEFAVACVVIAYSAIWRYWCAFLREKKAASPKPHHWLLVQLFPSFYLKKGDLIETLATELYKSVGLQEVKSIKVNLGYSPEFGYCVIDEAQAIGRLLENQFRSTVIESDKRSLLSPLLSGVKKILHTETILAGTGWTLLQVENDVLTGIAKTERPNYFIDFELLKLDKIQDMVKTFLVYKGENKHENDTLNRATEHLVGRPRFVADFITRAITNDFSLEQAVLDYLGYMLKLSPEYADDDSFQAIINNGRLAPGPKTIADSFKTLKFKPATLFKGKREQKNPFYCALIDAYLLACGESSSPNRSPALLELGIGYCDKRDPKHSHLEFEPFVLMMAMTEIKSSQEEFENHFVGSVFDSKSHIGTRFELLAGWKLATFFAANMESFLGDVIVPVGFKQKWEIRLTGYGRIAKKASNKNDLIQHLEDGIDIIYPDNNAGPDLIIRFYEDDALVITFLIQCKVRDEVDTKKALLTIDPDKFYFRKRGSNEESPIKNMVRIRKKIIGEVRKGLVVRVLISALAKIEEERTRMMENGDLLIVIDSTKIDSVMGETLMNKIRSCRADLPKKFTQLDPNL